MHADPRTRRRSITTVAVCLTATVLLLATASADTAAEIGRARALEADGRVDIAIEHLRAVLTGESGGTDAALLLELARLTDDVDEALALADEALANTRDMSLRALAHVMRGDYLYAAGLYNQASAEYTTAAEQGAPEHPELRRAASLLALGDIAAAIEVYDKAAEGDDEEIADWAAIGRGRALLARGDEVEAALELEQLALEFAGRPTRAHALAAAADALIAHGDIAHARELLLQLLDEFPDTFESTLADNRVRMLDRRLTELAPPDHASPVPESE